MPLSKREQRQKDRLDLLHEATEESIKNKTLDDTASTYLAGNIFFEEFETEDCEFEPNLTITLQELEQADETLFPGEHIIQKLIQLINKGMIVKTLAIEGLKYTVKQECKGGKQSLRYSKHYKENWAVIREVIGEKGINVLRDHFVIPAGLYRMPQIKFFKAF